ncbi:hypothetical protein ABIB40_000472 [Pedobacter sp. UYP30]|uniref:hypothetical protein n=1 Tax=Pedobacter sp. UYP30 TaxID=1756400 RepID=UPI00339692F9
MNKITGLMLGLLTLGLTSFEIDKAELSFKEKLAKSKISFEMPVGYKEIPVIANKQMLYDYAIKNVDENFELRVALRPLDERLKVYEEEKIKLG